MHRIVILLILILSTHLSFGQGNSSVQNSNTNYNVYQNLIEKHQQYQTELTEHNAYFKKVRAANYVLNGRDLIRINRLMSKVMVVLDQSLDFNNPQPENSEKQTQSHALMKTHLRIASYRTYMLQAELLGQSIKLNDLINEENKLYREHRNSLKRISKKIKAKSFRQSILNTWALANSLGAPAQDDTLDKHLMKDIKGTVYYKNYLENPVRVQHSKQHFKGLQKDRRKFHTKLALHKLHWDLAFRLSRVFGNTTGLLATRRGKLKKDTDFINSALKCLEPLDVILEKTPFRLTDRFIPGYWTHAALYVGNEAQLRALGVWDHPLIVAHHQAIKAGHCIIEAIRSDVRIATLQQCANIDDYAQLRLINEPALAKKREMLIRAFAQIGKQYDFRFDAESSEKLVCSELPYITFDQINFNTSKRASINTISSDQVAEQGLPNHAFKLMMLYVDGKKIEATIMQEIYRQLLSLGHKEISRYKRSIRD